MKRSNVGFGAALAGLALATLAGGALAQQADPNAPPGHTQPAPSNTPAHPEWGATDPTRSGTMTRSRDNLNNNRLPQNPPAQDTTTSTTTDTSTTTNTDTGVTTTTPADTYTSRQTTSDMGSTAPPAQLPRTASSTPLAATAGLLSLGAALALRGRRS